MQGGSAMHMGGISARPGPMITSMPSYDGERSTQGFVQHQGMAALSQGRFMQSSAGVSVAGPAVGVPPISMSTMQHQSQSRYSTGGISMIQPMSPKPSSQASYASPASYAMQPHQQQMSYQSSQMTYGAPQISGSTGLSNGFGRIPQQMSQQIPQQSQARYMQPGQSMSVQASVGSTTFSGSAIGFSGSAGAGRTGSGIMTQAEFDRLKSGQMRR